MNHELPEELHEIAEAVALLAAVDRAGAPGLEDRVTRASVAALRPDNGRRLVHEGGARPTPAPARRVPIGWATPKRLAAAVALAGSALALLVAVRWAPGPVPTEPLSAAGEVEVWLAVVVPFDGGLSSEIGQLSEEASRVGDGLTGWAGNDTFDEGAL